MIFLPLDDSSTAYEDINKDLVGKENDKDRFRYHNFPVSGSILKTPVSDKLNQANLLLNYIKKVQMTGQQPKRRDKSTLTKSNKGQGLTLSAGSRNPELALNIEKKKTRENVPAGLLPYKTFDAYSLAASNHEPSNRPSRLTSQTSQKASIKIASHPLYNPYRSNDEQLLFSSGPARPLVQKHRQLKPRQDNSISLKNLSVLKKQSTDVSLSSMKSMKSVSFNSGNNCIDSRKQDIFRNSDEDNKNSLLSKNLKISKREQQDSGIFLHKGKSKHYQKQNAHEKCTRKSRNRQHISISKTESSARKSSIGKYAERYGDKYSTGVSSSAFCHGGQSCDEESRAPMSGIALCLKCKRSLSRRQLLFLAQNRQRIGLRTTQSIESESNTDEQPPTTLFTLNVERKLNTQQTQIKDDETSSQMLATDKQIDITDQSISLLPQSKDVPNSPLGPPESTQQSDTVGFDALKNIQRLDKGTAISSQRVQSKALSPQRSNYDNKQQKKETFDKGTTVSVRRFQPKNSDRAIQTYFKYEKVHRPMTAMEQRQPIPSQPTYETYYNVNSRYAGPESINGRRFIIMDKPDYYDFLEQKKRSEKVIRESLTNEQGHATATSKGGTGQQQRAQTSMSAKNHGITQTRMTLQNSQKFVQHHHPEERRGSVGTQQRQIVSIKDQNLVSSQRSLARPRSFNKLHRHNDQATIKCIVQSNSDKKSPLRDTRKRNTIDIKPKGANDISVSNLTTQEPNQDGKGASTSQKFI